jgi:hypothetical protein
MTTYYEQNRERLMEYQRRYRAANKEQIAAYNASYYKRVIEPVLRRCGVMARAPKKVKPPKEPKQPKPPKAPKEPKPPKAAPTPQILLVKVEPPRRLEWD